jgi:putative flippase GtrA
VKPAGARLLRFVLSGGLASLIFFAGSYVLMALGWTPFAANLVAYALGFIVGYLLQRGWTFEAAHDHAAALPRYLILQVACAALVALAGELGARVLRVPPLMVALGSTALSSCVTYAGSSLWVFRRR